MALTPYESYHPPCRKDGETVEVRVSDHEFSLTVNYSQDGQETTEWLRFSTLHKIGTFGNGKMQRHERRTPYMQGIPSDRPQRIQSTH